MLTEKEIASMRKNVNQRWSSWFLVILSILMVFSAGLRFFTIDVLCQRTGITWSQIWTVALWGPDINTIYIGAELKAQELLHEAYFGLALAIFMAACAFTLARQRKNNILLLEYIDKEKSAKEEKECGPVLDGRDSKTRLDLGSWLMLVGGAMLVLMFVLVGMVGHRSELIQSVAEWSVWMGIAGLLVAVAGLIIRSVHVMLGIRRGQKKEDPEKGPGAFS